MTILELLTKAGLAAADLQRFLDRAAADYPDLAPKARELSAALGAAVSIESLASLTTAVTTEVADILRGQIDPRDNPSNAI